MGKLQGELDLIGIDTLFQALSQRQTEGFLDVRCGERRIVLSITAQGIRMLSGVRQTRPLGEILVRAGKITPEQLLEMLDEQRKDAVPLGEIVVRRGILPQSMIENALRKQVGEEIHELFAWTGATFEFRTLSEGPPAGDQGPRAAVILDGNVMAIMLEAARRNDELQEIRALIPDDRLVPSLMELPCVPEDSGLDRASVEEIAPLVDGKRSVEEILEASLYPKFTVLRTLYGLAMNQTLKIRDRAKNSASTVLGATKSRIKAQRRSHAILVLSDSSTFRPGLALRLHGAGYVVFEERCSTDPAAFFRKNHVDAVIADATLEAPEGQDLCRRLRESGGPPFILLTATVSPQLAVQAMESGARFILPKPLDEVRLLERLAELLPRAEE